ncbi:MAG: OsmC family protein [Xanthomonadales bacterium]|nr:OsmC family protein [Xanthomonadales bacterium]
MQRKTKFKNSRGEQLAGVIHKPDAGAVRACVLFAHCFTCTKNIKAAVNIAEALVAEGLGVFRFDFTGLGDSEGEFSDTHFSSNVQDLVDAAGFLESELGPVEILVGHSLGGTAALAAAHQIDSVVAVATIGSPADAEHVLHLLQDDLNTIEAEGEAQVRLAGRPFSIRKDFVNDVRSQSVRDGISQLRRALLVMHSPIDELVPISEASRIFQSALHPKSFVSLDDADHLLTRDSDSRYAGQVLSAWVTRFLANLPAGPSRARFEPGSVVLSGSPDDMFVTAVNADGHQLLADEPESVGGSDRGPTPYDLLAAALGTCTVMTLNMYARHKNLSLQGVEVVVKHDRIHADDCQDCDTRTGKIDRLTRELSFTGDLDKAQRKRLLEIADRCPVHRTLESEIRIESELKTG